VVLSCNNFDILDLGVMVPGDKILDAARAEKADMIGLSGLITPSLDEMVSVAAEMEKQGISIPLLIGGATTSKKHTALKIAPAYHGPVAFVPDASRAVGIVNNLFGAGQKEAFVNSLKQEYSELARAHLAKKAAVRILPLAEARRRKIDPGWTGYVPPRPSFIGTKVFENYPLADLIPYIDWRMFLRAWNIPRHAPFRTDSDNIDAQTEILLKDARGLLEILESQKIIKMRAVIGFFPANTVGDDIDLFRDDSRHHVILRAHHLRRQEISGEASPCPCLSDFMAPLESGIADFIGVFAVSAGFGVEDYCRNLKESHDDYNIIMTRALSDRLAEALAEKMHERVRKEYWGYAAHENLGQEQILREKFQGIRPAPGYPACPDHTEKGPLFELLDVEKSIGISLTESFAMIPAASVCGWYFSHPRAKYFAVGLIDKDQIQDYAQRKNRPPADIERWLNPYLAYEPGVIKPARLETND